MPMSERLPSQRWASFRLERWAAIDDLRCAIGIFSFPDGVLALSGCSSHLEGPELQSFGIFLASFPDSEEFKPVFVVFGGDSDDVLHGEVWCSLVVQLETTSNFVNVCEALLIHL